MAGETPVTLSAPGQSDVIIWVTKLDHNVDKPIISIPIPRNKTTMDAETAPDTLIIDIGRVNQVISFQGHLHDETTESAQEKKTNLLKLVYYERAITITWGTGSREQAYTGNINKIMITETPGIVGAQKTGYESEKNFAVQLSLIVGTDK